MNSLTTRRISIALLSVVASAVISIGAQAATPNSEAVSRNVSYADLNLDSVSGAQVLYARLRSAARTVCAPLNTRDLKTRAAWQACYAGAMASAVTQVNSVAVTQLHAANAGSHSG